MNEEPASEKQIKFATNLGVYQDGMTKTECRLAIDRALNKGEEDKPVETVKVGIGLPAPMSDVQVGVYTSYAKDIFCATVNEPALKAERAEDIMNAAIELVKQAQEAFS